MEVRCGKRAGAERSGAREDLLQVGGACVSGEEPAAPPPRENTSHLGQEPGWLHVSQTGDRVFTATANWLKACYLLLDSFLSCQ